MRVAVLSPHRDDAAFSCGLSIVALMQAGAAVTVVNVFTQSSYAVDVRSVDPALPLVEAVSAARLREDRAFMADALKLTACNEEQLHLRDLAWLDAPLRLAVAAEQVLASPLTLEQVDAEAATLANELQFLREFEIVFVPLALGDHIDHRVAREAAACVLSPERLCWYEDLPYAARMTVEKCNTDALRTVTSKSASEFQPHVLHLPDGVHLKRRLAMHYQSQIANDVAVEMAAYADRRALAGHGAERWWATPRTGRRILQVLAQGDAVCTVDEEQG